MKPSIFSAKLLGDVCGIQELSRTLEGRCIGIAGSSVSPRVVGPAGVDSYKGDVTHFNEYNVPQGVSFEFGGSGGSQYHLVGLFHFGFKAASFSFR